MDQRLWDLNLGFLFVSCYFAEVYVRALSRNNDQVFGAIGLATTGSGQHIDSLEKSLRKLVASGAIVYLAQMKPLIVPILSEGAEVLFQSGLIGTGLIQEPDAKNLLILYLYVILIVSDWLFVLWLILPAVKLLLMSYSILRTERSHSGEIIGGK
ncbi:uncharacterized protein LOC130761230 isoform X1 [Actinidia eriantha]|uniref:uncharacterized protein LOC130761230 isoform X1 n=1 Tax=Actinidia eriantha TaxID=165200 RepID=UPI0025901C37|nr:uncharacterized protein LOC130761230 isoform X1 [Actinidia eriantha]